MVVRASPNQLTRASSAVQSSGCDPERQHDGNNREDKRHFPRPFGANFRRGGTQPGSGGNADDHHSNNYDRCIAGGNNDYG